MDFFLHLNHFIQVMLCVKCSSRATQWSNLYFSVTESEIVKAVPLGFPESTFFPV